jgi:hypothetical protein
MKLRRTLAALAGAVGLVTPLVAVVATQGASATTAAKASPAWNHPICQVFAHPAGGFIETGLGSTTSSVAFVLTVRCKPVYSETTVELSSPQLSNACRNTLSWYSPTGKAGSASVGRGEAFNVFLDDDGNATAVVWGGPSCAATRDLVTADLIAPPYPTATTHVVVLPPKTTKSALLAYPPKEVEDSITSSVDAIFYAEFPGSLAEQKVEFSDAQLYDMCAGHIIWVGADEAVLGRDVKSVTTTTDDNGNAFVVALAGPSCAAGVTKAQASIVKAPYKSVHTTFTILTPRAR